VARAIHRGEAPLAARLEQARETTMANTLAAAPRRELIHRACCVICARRGCCVLAEAAGLSRRRILALRISDGIDHAACGAADQRPTIAAGMTTMAQSGPPSVQRSPADE